MIDLFSSSSASLLATLVTAVATVALWYVTSVLARETKRLADTTSQPQVVASVQPNRWGGGFADLHVANTGNATAFEIEIKFDPPLEKDPVDADAPTPFQSISLLKPGQALSSFLVEYDRIIDVIYDVTVSWKRDPAKGERESLSYKLRVADVRGVTHLGSPDPVIQIAEDIRKLREEFGRVASGARKPKVEISSRS